MSFTHKVVGKILEDNSKSAIFTVCPDCGKKYKKITNDVGQNVWYCDNPKCKSYVSRSAMMKSLHSIKSGKNDTLWKPKR